MRSKNSGDRSNTREVIHPAAAQPRVQRRSFLLALGAGGAGAAIVAARALTAGPAAPDAARESSPGDKGYAETDHVRRYYRTAKI